LVDTCDLYLTQMYISFQLHVFCNGFYSCSSVINIVLLEENYLRTIVVSHICEGSIQFTCASFICDYADSVKPTYLKLI